MKTLLNTLEFILLCHSIYAQNGRIYSTIPNLPRQGKAGLSSYARTLTLDPMEANYDLSQFSSNFYGAGVRINLPNGLFGIRKLDMLELRYGHYTKSVGMKSDIISLNLRFK
ncbi:hypothetical protein [Sphingobacterium sp.]|uniref:hypothetical protein n=1 Tax=Sphingobacterium sp. TaxID=341027 RepID=UPI0028A1D6CF|nr:hypothetical protein [Sphingobacterium sp.]